MRRRKVLAFIISCLIIQCGTAMRNGCEVVSRGTAAIQPEGTSYTEVLEDSTAQEELEVPNEIKENEASELEYTLAEADKIIAEAEELLNQRDMMDPEETESISSTVTKERVTLASRGGHIVYKPAPEAPWYDLSQEELELMAQVVQAEAGGEPYEGQVAVANVIFNRVKMGWGETVTEVINQKGQFTKTRKKSSTSVKDAVLEALKGRNAVPEGTLFFQNLDISTSFRIPKTKEYVAKIGQHTFYR